MNKIFEPISKDMKILLSNKETINSLYDSADNICEWLYTNNGFENSEVTSEFFYFLKTCPDKSIDSMLADIADNSFVININDIKTIIEEFLKSNNFNVAKSAAHCLISCCGKEGLALVKEVVANKVPQYKAINEVYLLSKR